MIFLRHNLHKTISIDMARGLTTRHLQQIGLLFILSALGSHSLFAESVNPVIHWRMEGNGHDNMGNEDMVQLRHVTFSNDAVEGSQSMSFDNAKDSEATICETLPVFNDRSFTHKAFNELTLSLWFKTKPLLTNTDQRLYLIEFASRNGLSLYVQKDTLYGTFSTHTGKTYYSLLTTPIEQEKWNHVVLWFKLGETALFLNGKKVSQGELPNSLTFISKSRNGSSVGSVCDHFFDLKLKHRDNITNPETAYSTSLSFNGLIDDIQLYHIALTDNDITKLFNHQKPIETYQKLPFSEKIESNIKPIMHWPMEGNGKDVGGKEHILELKNTSFSNDSIMGEQSLYFENSKKSIALIPSKLSPKNESKNLTHHTHKLRTISFWFKAKEPLPSKTEKQYLCIFGGLKGYSFYIQGNTLYATASTELKSEDKNQNKKNLDFAVLQAPYQANTWTHVTLIFDHGQAELFINSKLISAAHMSQSQSITLENHDVSFGSAYGTYFDKDQIGYKGSTNVDQNKHSFNGMLDDIKVFAIPLSPLNIVRLRENIPLFNQQSSKIHLKTSESSYLIAPQSTPSIRPHIHWRFEGNGKDTMNHQDLLQLRDVTFSNESVEGSQSLYFENTKDSEAIICETQPYFTGEYFTNLEFSQRTLSIWFKPLPLPQPTDKKLFLVEIAAKNGFSAYLQNSILYTTVSSYAVKAGFPYLYHKFSAPYKSNEWNHMVIRFKLGQAAMFLNGKKIDEKMMPNRDMIYYEGNGSSLGSINDAFFDEQSTSEDLISPETDYATGHSFHGLMDDVKFFDVALTDNDIKRLYGNHTLVDHYDPNKASPRMIPQPNPIYHSPSPVSETNTEAIHQTTKEDDHTYQLLAIGSALLIIGLVITCGAFTFFFLPKFKSH